jgi:hypothetical protein
MFVLAIGMALLLSWTVVGQRSEAKTIVPPSSRLVSADVELESRENSSLGYTAPITFTPAYTVFLPAVMNRWPSVPDTPVLNAISNPDGDGNYSVTWNAADLASTYTLQEDTNASFTNPTTRYSGSGTSWSASSKPAGTYYYRVKASNSWGDSGWSNVQQAIVSPPGQGISGRVTYRGNPIGGINVVLQRCTKTGTSTWTCSSLFTVATQSNGVYQFTDAPSLDSNQRYYVRYRNRNEGNADNPNYLRYWACNNIYSYAAGTNVAGGDFDVDNIPLTSPASGVTVALPYTFQWTRRSVTPSDSYQFELYDAADADPYWWSSKLGYVSSYTLGELPPGGFVAGVVYMWGIWVYGPDGFGISYQHRLVTFSSGVTSSQDAVQRLRRLHLVDIQAR